MGRFSSFWSVIILGTLIVFLIFFLPYERSARTNNVQWVGFIGKTSRDIAYNMAVIKDGIIVAGWTSSSTGDQNALLVKLSKEGKLLWQKELGGSGTDGATCVKATSDGGFLAAVLSDSQDGDLPIQFGNQDIWLLKYDANGNLQWKNCYGTKGYETAFDVLEDEGYLLVGYTTLNGSEDFWVVKTDLSGKMLWQKTLGGSDWDQATSVISTKDGGFVVAATIWSEEIVGKSRSADFVLMKFDKDNNLTFTKTYGGSSDDIAQKIIEIEDGYALIGTTWSDDGDVSEKHRGSDYWFIKTDKTGNLIWQKCLGDDLDEIAYALQQLDNTYLIAGVSYSYVVGLRARSHGGGDMLIVKVK